MRPPVFCTTITALTLLPGQAAAAVSAETQFILNTLSFLYHGMLVLLMAAGFTMLEGGLVRTKSVSTILLKNITLVAVVAIGFWATGYGLMFEGVDGGFIGTPVPWGPQDEPALSGDYSAGAASASVWLFQSLFAVTAVSIISGTLAERIRLWPFFLFVAVMAMLLYPIQGAWGWGGGWLDALGFVDFAGGTHVHSAAGWAALTGAVVLGPRRGRFLPDGSVRPLPASSLPLATLGAMLLWLGWLGFNGGSQGSMSSAADIISMANVYVNTVMASCGGILAAVLMMQFAGGKIDLTMVLNGALAGLVSITADPSSPGVPAAILIGAAGTVLMVLTSHLLLRLRIDDVIGAIPVHLPCGLWGTLAVCISNPAAELTTQIIGASAVSAFMALTSLAAWLLLRAQMRLRLSQGEEAIGIDRVETGALAYPEFTTRTVGNVD
ncbi:ammonium transporter [Roseovarius sp. CAU 1744]|uniref:ammonium transporter n=1 Tax=Roseovarius sp. CAU 1744 TaxID=3140368 RepID=UPI00325B313A